MARIFKIISTMLLTFSLLTFSQQGAAQDFKSLCEGNGRLYSNVLITSVIIMGAEFDRVAYISINNQSTILAKKSYESSRYLSDQILLSTAIKANILKTPVDLCVTSNSDQLHGINIK